MASHAKLEGPANSCSFPSCLDVCKGQSQNHMLSAIPFEKGIHIFEAREAVARMAGLEKGEAGDHCRVGRKPGSVIMTVTMTRRKTTGPCRL